MEIKVMGFQLASSASSNKHYTVLVTDTGHLIVHYGARKLVQNNQGNGVAILKPGSLTIEDFTQNPSGWVSALSKVEKILKLKSESGSYDELFFLSYPLTIKEISYPYIDESNAHEVTGRFNNLTQIPGSPVKSYSSDSDKVEDLRKRSWSQYIEFCKEIAEDAGLDTSDTGSIIDFTPADNKPSVIRKYFTEVENEVKRPNGQRYLPREIMGHIDVSLMRHFREKSLLTRLVGPPGSGKTALCEASFGEDLITATGHGDMTVASLAGGFIPRLNRSNGESEWEWQFGPLSTAMMEGRPFFFDEINRAPSDVQNAIISATDDRRMLRLDERHDLEPIVAKDGFYVVIGYNPDTITARPLDEAIISRFMIGITVTTDYQTMAELKVPKSIIEVAKAMGEANKSDRGNGGPGVWVPQARELLAFRDIMNAEVGEEFALANFVASCPSDIDVPILKAAIKKTYGFEVSVPELGPIV